MPKEPCSKPGKLCYRRLWRIYPGRFGRRLELRRMRLPPQLPPQGGGGDRGLRRNGAAAGGGDEQQEEVQDEVHGGAEGANDGVRGEAGVENAAERRGR